MRRIHNVYDFDDPHQRAKLINGEPNPNPHFIPTKSVDYNDLADHEKVLHQQGWHFYTPEEEKKLNMPF